LAHFQLVGIHPFIDGNGRAARLVLNLLLVRAGYPPTILQAQDRLEYYQALEQAHAGQPGPFVNFVGSAVERALDVYLAVTRRVGEA
jgi:Fic family protein